MAQSDNQKKLTARTAAVQALYQAAMNKDGIGQLSDATNLLLNDNDETQSLDMNRTLYRDIVQGTLEHAPALENIVKELKTKASTLDSEPLLKAILLCGAYEITHTQTDKPIIINDYVSVTESFYGEAEKKLVNALLDKIKNQNKALNQK